MANDEKIEGNSKYPGRILLSVLQTSFLGMRTVATFVHCTGGAAAAAAASYQQPSNLRSWSTFPAWLELASLLSLQTASSLQLVLLLLHAATLLLFRKTLS